MADIDDIQRYRDGKTIEKVLNTASELFTKEDWDAIHISDEIYEEARMWYEKRANGLMCGDILSNHLSLLNRLVMQFSNMKHPAPADEKLVFITFCMREVAIELEGYMERTNSENPSIPQNHFDRYTLNEDEYGYYNYDTWLSSWKEDYSWAQSVIENCQYSYFRPAAGNLLCLVLNLHLSVQY